MKHALLILGALMLTACTHQPSEEISFAGFVPAHIEWDPPAPIEVVEVPLLLPLPGQYTRKAESPAVESTAPDERIERANAEARIEPAPEGFINAMQVWPYSESALYQLYTRPDRVTDIALEPGEALISASGADSTRWIIGDTTSGEGEAQRVHIIVKPTRVGLTTNLIIHSNRRSYHLELNSSAQTWMASVSWNYPQDRLHTLRRDRARALAAAPIVEALTLERLQFGYRLSGDTPSWRPLRAFDDGEKVYIQFPASITADQMPPLFVIGANGDAQLVNYRVRSPYYIVDRLFAAAELRLGKPSEVVRIERDDARRGSPRTAWSGGPRR